MGAVISMSHLKEVGITNIMLFHMTKDQSLFLRDLASSMAVLASHPATIPVLIIKLRLCEPLNSVSKYGNDLRDIEASGGLTGFDIWDRGELMVIMDSCDDPMLSAKAVKLNQCLIRESHRLDEAIAVMLIMKDFITSYVPSTEVKDTFCSKLVFKQNLILLEELSVLRSIIAASQRELILYRARTELQITGVYLSLLHHFKKLLVRTFVHRLTKTDEQPTRLQKHPFHHPKIDTTNFLFLLRN